MALNLESKKVIVDQVGTTASNALSLVIADARGVNVTHMTILREKAREQNIEIRVVRNTLAKLAFKGTDFECVNEVLAGPSLFGFSMEDPGAAARLFKEFAKDNDKFEVKALSISGQLLDNGQIDVLAKLPTLEQALGQLACVTLAPITKLVRTFNEVPTKVTRVVGAVRDKKQEAA
ncbi:MAG: 50S ribosomal protein L10 [Gammaproteobacteria bacterium]|nr:50S ribosomal protein L10 [Gammaproteobacteria bacterium]MDC0412569.1 50S ribosomal protein L10 [Porticoccus sp.]MDC1093631.1 50S ribosomal protein L10 [Porticoccus sp.]